MAKEGDIPTPSFEINTFGALSFEKIQGEGSGASNTLLVDSTLVPTIITSH
jgi:hypothetical protein